MRDSDGAGRRSREKGEKSGSTEDLREEKKGEKETVKRAERGER